VELCVALPGKQKLDGGWPKAVLRRTMAGRLPDAVRWRRGKEHLGWHFTTQLLDTTIEHARQLLDAGSELIADYVDGARLDAACIGWFERRDLRCGERLLEATELADWLTRRAVRSTPAVTVFPRTLRGHIMS
jgi:asparagine synthase (glutamine-hydrolysing)